MLNCIVTRITDDESILALPKDLINQLELKVNDLVTLKCGASETNARIKILSSGDSTHAHFIGLSSSCLTSLNIPANICFKLKTLSNKVFRLGPVIGILTFPGHLRNRLGYYGCYARRNKNNGLLYVFRGMGINNQRKIISGYYLDPISNTWKQGEFPFPDAVIDRLYPNSRISHILLEKVIGPAKIFNKKSMINKVDFFKALSDDELLLKYIPETRVLTSTSDLDYFLAKYSEVYLKPFNAMKGFGIVVVKKGPDGLLECLFARKGEINTLRISSTDEISEVLLRAAGRKRSYIIQQGIHRMEYRGGPFSLRPWAMKNGRGEWIMPGMFAKGTFGKGFLTNFTAGARLVPLPDLLREIGPKLPFSAKHFTTLTETLTLKTAAALDRKFGPLGELGLDIVFDTDGRPWLIEANGNPGNIPVFQQREYPAWRSQVFQLPLDYATFLAGFDQG